MKKKATEDQFSELHSLVTSDFFSRIKSGEASTQDLKSACKKKLKDFKISPAY